MDEQSVVNWLGDKSNALVQNCPKCDTLIEKNEGCSNMSCTVCSFCFCWTCGSDLNSKFHDKFFEDLC